MFKGLGGGMSGMGDMMGLMKQAQKMKKDMKKLKKEISKTNITVSDENNILTIIMNGDHVIQKISFNNDISGMDNKKLQNIIKESGARIVTVNKEFFVLEKSGRKEEVELLYRELSVFGIMQFTRSGRIAVTKDEMKISTMLAAFTN